MKEVNINHIEMDLDGDGIPEKYILNDKALNALFQTLANIAFSSDYNDLINQPDSLPASDVYEWAKNIAKPEYTKNEIGLENVDNTSDLNKPVSIAQQKAIDDAYANSNGYTDQKISELINNDTIHITSSERNKWNSAISGTDDTKDNVVSFTSNDTTNPTSWSDVSALTSGEKHTSIFTKISTMFKNIRYLYKLIGTTDISAIGNGTVTGGLSALNSNFKKSEILSKTFECTVKQNGIHVLDLQADIHLALQIRLNQPNYFATVRSLTSGAWYVVVENYDGTRVPNVTVSGTVYYVIK